MMHDKSCPCLTNNNRTINVAAVDCCRLFWKDNLEIKYWDLTILLIFGIDRYLCRYVIKFVGDSSEKYRDPYFVERCSKSLLKLY